MQITRVQLLRALLLVSGCAHSMHTAHCPQCFVFDCMQLASALLTVSYAQKYRLYANSSSYTQRTNYSSTCIWLYATAHHSSVVAYQFSSAFLQQHWVNNSLICLLVLTKVVH
jgi:hypothetical protein